MIDVGGGDSRLVDRLLARGVRCLTVLDISAVALSRARERLGAKADRVIWVEADVAGPRTIAAHPVDMWHDRAVFHFLTDAGDRAQYVEHASRLLKPGGTVIVGTFAPDGPERCSGLPVCRYDAAGISAEFGPRFSLIETTDEAHQTPSGAIQRFCFVRLSRTS